MPRRPEIDETRNRTELQVVGNKSDTNTDGTSIVSLLKGLRGIGGEVYYVDGNKSATGDGKAWATAYKTLTEAITASNSYISTSANRAWAARNTIYVKADTLTEDLTTFAEKCDIIGVGSYDANKQPGLLGTHVPANSKGGCRFINMRFLESLGSEGVFFTIGSTAGAGTEFIDCTFDSRGLVMTSAISITAMGFVKVTGCKFIGPVTAYSTAVILVGAGNAEGLEIVDNYMTGAIGIVINSSTTANAEFIRIERNTIHAATLTIDDNSDLALLVNNRLISLAADGGATAPGCIDANGFLAVGNILAGADSNGPWPNLDEHS